MKVRLFVISSPRGYVDLADHPGIRNARGSGSLPTDAPSASQPDKEYAKNCDQGERPDCSQHIQSTIFIIGQLANPY